MELGKVRARRSTRLRTLIAGPVGPFFRRIDLGLTALCSFDIVTTRSKL